LEYELLTRGGKCINLDTDLQLDQAAVDRGVDAWQELQKDSTWERWLLVGWSIDEARRAVLKWLGRDKPGGKEWADVFGAWLEATGFIKIDAGDRTRLAHCMEHLQLIEAWRADLSIAERLRMNHPATVWRKFKSAVLESDKEPSEKKPSVKELKQEIERLQGELASASDTIAQLQQELSDEKAWNAAKPHLQAA
jgi:hypothetical protein